MSRYVRYFLIVAALLAVGLLAACGSDDDDGDDNGSGDNAAEQPVDGDDDDGDGDDNGDGDGDGDSGDSSDELREFAGQFGISEVKVTYTMSGLGVGGDDGQMVLYSKPPDRWRMDIANADGDITMISNGDSTLMCASDGDGGTCFESPLGDALPIPFLNIFTDPGGFGDLVDNTFGVDVDRSSREIAGQDATCFSFSGDEGSGEYCFRDDGVLLLLRAEEFDGEETFTMEATDVSNSVSDSDLEAPYDILDIGGIIP